MFTFKINEASFSSQENGWSLKEILIIYLYLIFKIPLLMSYWLFILIITML